MAAAAFSSIRRIAGGAWLHPAVWRADQLGSTATRGVSTGFGALDAELPGAGWPLSNLVELLGPRAGIGEMRLLLPAVAPRSRAGEAVMLIAPPAVPYAPALAAHGVALERLFVVHAPQRADRLWATEQALKSASLGALLAWLPEDDDILVLNDQLRRLQLAAQASRALVFVFRPLAAQANASPAPLRIELSAAAIDRLALRIVKRQGPPLESPIVIDLPTSVHVRERTPRPEAAQPRLQPAIPAHA